MAELVYDFNSRCKKSGFEDANENATDYQVPQVFGHRCTGRCNTKGQHHNWQTDFGRGDFGEDSHDRPENDEHEIVEGEEKIVLITRQVCVSD